MELMERLARPRRRGWVPDVVGSRIDCGLPIPTVDGELSAQQVRGLARTGSLYYVVDEGAKFFVLRDWSSVDRKPMLIAQSRAHNLWLYQSRVYRASDLDLTPEDVVALVNEAANRRRLQLEKAHALQAMTQQLDSRARRQAIPQEVKVHVWQRDCGSCVQCGSRENLEFDHIIPLAMGGSNSVRNIQLLCEVCNRRKGATLG
jgi:5-methylcytosine-specific restriction endonuclease McrA